MSSFAFLLRAADALIKSGHRELRDERFPARIRIAFARESARQAQEALDEAAAQLPKPWSKPAVARAFSLITTRR